MSENASTETLTTAWTSNATLEQIADRLRQARVATLLTHEKPDGDALGSTLALARVLSRLNVEATPVYVPPWSPRFDSIVGRTPVVFLDEDDRPEDVLPDSPDAIVVVDTGSWGQLTKVRSWLESRHQRAMLIDHHLEGANDVAPLRWVDKEAPAACHSVAEVCRLLLGVQRVADLPVDIAEPLYVGLATDTGWFRHANVTPGAFALASELLEAGVDHAGVFQRVEQMDRPARLRLLGRALASLELHGDDQIALMCMRRKDFEDCCGDQEDAGGLTDMLLTVAPVRVAASLTEIEGERTKVSLRSKRSLDPSQRTVDVNEVARRLNGGGHAQAAGARLDMPLAEAKEKVVGVLVEAIFKSDSP